MKIFGLMICIHAFVFATEFQNFKLSLLNGTSFFDNMKQSLQELINTIQKISNPELNSITTIPFNMTSSPPLAPPNPNFKKIQYLSNYAGAAYCETWALQSWQCSHCVELGIDIQFMGLFEDVPTGGLGYVAVDNKKKTIALVFRGSSNIRNWVLDLSVNQLPYPDAGEKALVHSGFLTSVRALKPSFIPIMQPLVVKFPDYQILVTGHSLGAAVAVLALTELKSALNLPWSKFNLYTYGEPRVGNSIFAIWLNHNLDNQFRVVNEYDPVPTVPYTWLNYAHHQREFFIKRDNYTACPVSDIYLEDASCAPNVMKLTIMDHITYFGQIMALGC